MSERKSRRGRPKGTGIDDTSRLLAIAALLAENPDLKPTTAIKSIGITDPSAIRRLRDKLKATQKFKPMPQATANKPRFASPITQRSKLTPKISAANTNSPSCHPGNDWFQTWMGLGLAAAKSAIEAQAIVTGSILYYPAVSVLVRQQFAVSEMAMKALSAPRPVGGGRT